MSALRNQNTVAPPAPPVVRLPKLKNPAEREPGNSPVLPVANRIIDNIEKVILGKHNEIVLTLAAYYAGGHVFWKMCPAWPRPCWPAPFRAASVARSSALITVLCLGLASSVLD